MWTKHYLFVQEVAKRGGAINVASATGFRVSTINSYLANTRQPRWITLIGLATLMNLPSKYFVWVELYKNFKASLRRCFYFAHF